MNLLEEKSKMISISQPGYPKLLKNIARPPKLLYYKGTLGKEENCFAVVGTRRYSDYGKDAVCSITAMLSRAGLTIVSGMARGIDTFAHKTALENNGRTIAVLGTGLDVKSIYPKENIKLALKILEKGGCLLSEYPEGTRGTQFTFPQRNRLISGISLGVLVVEARLKSGALITADWAKKQKKKNFAVPGPIRSLTSRGTNLLIKEGAYLAERAEDNLEKIGIQPLVLAEQRKETSSPEEKLILEALEKGALYIDKIIEQTGLPPSRVSTSLSLMELDNRVKNLGGNTYVLADKSID